MSYMKRNLFIQHSGFLTGDLPIAWILQIFRRVRIKELLLSKKPFGQSFGCLVAKNIPELTKHLIIKML